MDDQQHFTPSPPRPTRRRVRARTVPALPPMLWFLLGGLMVLLGLWSLRPTADAPTAPTAPGESSATEATPTDDAPVSLAGVARPGLEPISPVIVGEEPVPPSDTGAGAVGQGALTAVAAGEAATATDAYTVVPGDTLFAVAARFEVGIEDLMALNGISDPNALQVGQVLAMPSRVTLLAAFQKLIPDSELVLSPAYRGFDVGEVARQHGGFLEAYSETVEGAELDGPAIVELVSQRYSVGARPLLAMLDFQSGWLTQKEPEERSYPMGMRDPLRAGLFFQLSWAANRMNEGYYGTLSGQDPQLRFSDGTRALYHEDTNPGTAAIQNVFAVQGTPDSWSEALSESGFFATYVRLFGDPWADAIEPLVPETLAQPDLSLPWPSGQTWFFTGGPHGGWGDLSGWAALDFVPPDSTGCAPSEYWATAAASGTVIRSENGEVVLDLDDDGFVGTGWSLLYMHMAAAGRVTAGTTVSQGDAIGRPSCEGGFSDAAHLHIARRYNGQWISADGTLPFMLDGWRAETGTRSYEGYLGRGTERREACACRQEEFNGLTAR